MNNRNHYYLYRQWLEKLEKERQKTWLLIVMARFLLFLTAVIVRYL